MEQKLQKNNNKKEIITQEMIDIVIARLDTIPPNVHISIGDRGSFSIKELKEKVQNRDDEVGKKIVEMQLAYIRSLANMQPQQSNATANN